MKTNKLMFTISMLLLITSCVANNSSVSTQSVDNTIIVSAPPEINTYKINDVVEVVVQNNSDNEIAFLPENAIVLMQKNGGQWIEIENIMKNSLYREAILSSKKQRETSAIVIPIVPKVSDKYTAVVRITITGTDQSTNQKVEGYVDVTLSP